jgi:Flp pilus assembly protein TadG
MRNKKFDDDQRPNIRSKEFIMMYQSQSFPRDESGAVMVLAAILMVALLGIAALAIDIGHLMVVRNELQNAADAGALAGANYLAPYLPTNPPTPDFDSAQAAATPATEANKTDNTLITDCQVEVGYFNLITRVLQARTISPTTLDVPAVRVTVSRVAGQNGGAVLPFLAQVLGINFMNASAQAMAMLSCPSTAPPGGLFPIAINQQILQYLWNTKDSNNPNLSQPFNIGSDYHYPDYTTGQVAGQWTSFYTDDNNVPTIRDLLNNGNPDPIQIGKDIWIEPGTKDTLFGDVNDVPNLVKADGTGKTVFVPVVQSNSLDTHALNPVRLFIPIKVLYSIGQNKKYIKAQFVKKAHMPSDNLGGPCYGAYSSAKLVN